MFNYRRLWQVVAGFTWIAGVTASAFASPNTPSVFADAHTAIATQSSEPKAPVSNVSNAMVVLNPTAPVLNIHGYYLQDVYSGKVLASQNADQTMEPASLTKLMTLYLVFEALDAGRIHINDLVPISQNAWHTGGSRMFVKVGDKIPVGELINGVIIDSGNDASVALAEYVGGTEDAFVSLMNEQAKLLGMKNTHYMDCTGLPNPQHYTTPHDMAILAQNVIVNFPQYYPLFSQKTLTFNGITQSNRNRLLWRDASVDGLKTGHTDEAGFCLIASAQRNGMRLLSVLLGAPTDELRAEYSDQLFTYGYHFFETHQIYKANIAIQRMPLYYGSVPTLPVGVSDDFYVTLPTGQYGKLDMQLHINVPLKAPIKHGDKVGTVSAVLAGKEMKSADLIALTDVAEGGFLSRLIDKVKLATGHHG